MIIRQIELPDSVSGTLSTCAMPGRTGAFEVDLVDLAASSPDIVISLTPADEIEKESPEYAQAIEASTLPFVRWSLPTPDFGIVRDRQKFMQEVQNAAKALREGRRIVVQCGAGIGRSGTFAIATLIALGLSQEDANVRVEATGAHPESWSQQELLDWFVVMMGKQ